MLSKGATNEQNYWHYFDRVNGRRDYLHHLSTLASAREKAINE